MRGLVNSINVCILWHCQIIISQAHLFYEEIINIFSFNLYFKKILIREYVFMDFYREKGRDKEREKEKH